MSAKIGTGSGLTFTADGLNFARDYYTTDRKMRMTLSALQRLPNMIHGVEITFPSTLTECDHKFEDKDVTAVYWQLLPENNESVFYTYDADSGFFNMTSYDSLEVFEGFFNFKSTHSDGTFLEVKSGRFRIEGRDDLTL
ncbi:MULTISPECIES: hypothetical protein [unclassified Pseudomonas]|uniref:hypothetical protein n=1 Tax=unclassified Pseudomonas TaxID=196821 RepID=UPI00249BCB9B|nr:MULTISPECIES: hypothetical protein [unclassified Pseudomonas]MDI3249526.1 hypothetical protein [Pseudomonas sp. AL10]MDI3265574.1 hypothetical protein [Pseudomonas sp. AL15]